MKAIVTLFWQICLLRQSPARVPANGPFLALVVLGNLACSIAVSVAFDGSPGLLTVANSILVGQATTALLVLGALTARGLGERFVTTITAWFGCDLIITACFSVLLPIGTLLGQFALSIGLLAFLIWSVAVAGYILHKALTVQFAIGIGVAMGISVFSALTARVTIGG